MKRLAGLLFTPMFLLSSACSNTSSSLGGAITPFISGSSQPDTVTFTLTSSPSSLPTILLMETPPPPKKDIHGDATLEALTKSTGLTKIIPGYGCNASEFSPDGRWAIVDKEPYVFRTDGTVRWSLQPWFKTRYIGFPFYTPEGNRSYSIIGEHWSLDGKHLYFSLCDPVTQEGPSDLYDLDLDTGDVTNLYISGYITFSPDDRYIVYSPYDSHGSTLQIRGIQSGDEVTSYLGGYSLYNGSLVWSSDGKQLAYTALWNNEDSHKDVRRFIFLLDMNSFYSRFLTTTQGYYVYSWIEHDLIELKEENSQGVDNYLIFNLDNYQTYQVTSLTPTP